MVTELRAEPSADWVLCVVVVSVAWPALPAWLLVSCSRWSRSFSRWSAKTGGSWCQQPEAGAVHTVPATPGVLPAAAIHNWLMGRSISSAWHSQGCRRPNAPSCFTTAGRLHSRALSALPATPQPQPQPPLGLPSPSTSLALAQLPHGISDQSPLLEVCCPIQLQEEVEVSITPLPPAWSPLAFP